MLTPRAVLDLALRFQTFMTMRHGQVFTTGKSPKVCLYIELKQIAKYLGFLSHLQGYLQILNYWPLMKNYWWS